MLVSADGAPHVFGEVPTGNFEAVPFNHGFVAVGAVSVLRWVPWHVAQISVV